MRTMKEKDFIKSLIKQIEPFIERKKKAEGEMIYHFNLNYRNQVLEELEISKKELMLKLKEQVEFMYFDKEQPFQEKKDLSYVVTLINGVIRYGLDIEELVQLLSKLEMIIK